MLTNFELLTVDGKKVLSILIFVTGRTNGNLEYVHFRQSSMLQATKGTVQSPFLIMFVMIVIKSSQPTEMIAFYYVVRTFTRLYRVIELTTLAIILHETIIILSIIF